MREMFNRVLRTTKIGILVLAGSALVPPMTANFLDVRSSCPIGLSRRVTPGSGTPLMRVFCFLGASESLTVPLFAAFTGPPGWRRGRAGPGCVPVVSLPASISGLYPV